MPTTARVLIPAQDFDPEASWVYCCPFGREKKVPRTVPHAAASTVDRA
ncbi:MAG TPA: hypothetical protein VF409_13840 [Sphingomonas sp.]